jgi:phosphoglycerate dehydrogenase-like enzyme
VAEGDPIVVGVLDVFPPTTRQMILDRFDSDFDVRFLDDDAPDARRRLATTADVLLVMWGGVDGETMTSSPRLRLIQKLGVGTDKIDLDAARDRGICVLRAAGINADAVADMALLFILAISRNLTTALDRYRRGSFAKEELRHESLQLVGRTVGLVGFGHIGRALAARLRACGCRILYHDPIRADEGTEARLGAQLVPFDELISQADVISLHAPSEPGAPPLLDADRLARMREGAIVINTARGGLIDLDALHSGLMSGRIRGAGLDVTDPEPLPPSSPLFSHPNVLITPHVGGAVINNMPLVLERARANVDALLSGGTWPEGADVVVDRPDQHRSGLRTP